MTRSTWRQCSYTPEISRPSNISGIARTLATAQRGLLMPRKRICVAPSDSGARRPIQSRSRTLSAADSLCRGRREREVCQRVPRIGDSAPRSPLCTPRRGVFPLAVFCEFGCRSRLIKKKVQHSHWYISRRWRRKEPRLDLMRHAANERATAIPVLYTGDDPARLPICYGQQRYPPVCCGGPRGSGIDGTRGPSPAKTVLKQSGPY